MPIRYLSVLAFVVLTVAACGGTGGGEEDTLPGDICYFCGDGGLDTVDTIDTLADTLPDTLADTPQDLEDVKDDEWGGWEDAIFQEIPTFEIIEEEVGEQPVTYETFGTMTLSRKGLLIGSKYVQFRFARMDYWKVPPEQWESRLKYIREAGFNGIATAACWARHERRQGTIDFGSPGLNLASFLDLATAQGLYVYFMAGPWIGEGAAGGCLPQWLALKPGTTAVLAADGKIVPREGDKDFIDALTPYFNAMNAVVSPRQITKSQVAKVVFYQFEDAWDLYAHLKEAMMLGAEFMSGVPIENKRPNGMQYFAALRQLAQVGGINLPMLTSITGQYPDGGRLITALGETLGVYPAFRFRSDDPYEPFEARLVALKAEMRSPSMHGTLYNAIPAIVSSCAPYPGHINRLFAAGADVVVVDGFDSAASTFGPGLIKPGASYAKVFPALAGLDLAFTQANTHELGVFTAEGLPTERYFALRPPVRFLDRVSGLIGSRELPLRTGPNNEGQPPFSVKNKNLGAIENEWAQGEFSAVAGVVGLFGDWFSDWFLAPLPNPQGRASYMIYGSDGTTLINLPNVEELDKTGQNNGKRSDQITTVTFADAQLPRHSNVVVPALDRDNLGPSEAGWGSKLLYLNHPLGAGYPVIEYCTSNLAEERDFNNRKLLVLYGEPRVKAEGVWLTEPGELSLMGFAGTPAPKFNNLPGGGLYADPGSKLAIQTQHDQTGSLVLDLPSGRRLQVLSTTAETAERFWFGKDPAGWDVGVSGLDYLDSVTKDGTKLKLTGKLSPGEKEIILLLHEEPGKISMDNLEMTCKWHAVADMALCSWEEPEAKTTIQGLSSFVVRSEATPNTPADLGYSQYPEAFLKEEGKAVSSSDPRISVVDGVLWYSTSVAVMNAPVEGTQVYLGMDAGADLVSAYVNGTYVGTATSLGGRLQSQAEVQQGFTAMGLNVPANLVKAGDNAVAFRVLLWGRSDRYLPEIQSFLPLLGEHQDEDELLPHLVVAGANPVSLKGIGGPAYLQFGGGKLLLNSSWYIGKGDATGFGRTFGMLSDWHRVSGASTPSGWSAVSVPSEAAPLQLDDGETKWLSAAFDRSPWAAEGTAGLDVILEGRGLMALVYLNGVFAGRWYSDEASLGQGLHSELQAGHLVRPVGLRSPGTQEGVLNRSRIRLPAEAMSLDTNRITVALFDLTPPGDLDLAVEGYGTIPGRASLSRMELAWNQDRLLSGTAAAPIALVQRTRTITIEPMPAEPVE
jgi:hypothetical protein